MKGRKRTMENTDVQLLKKIAKLDRQHGGGCQSDVCSLFQFSIIF